MANRHSRRDDHAGHDPNVMLDNRTLVFLWVQDAQICLSWDDLVRCDNRACTDRRPISDFNELRMESIEEHTLADEHTLANLHTGCSVKPRTQAVEWHEVGEPMQQNPANHSHHVESSTRRNDRGVRRLARRNRV
jgi:hypothetical protein